MRNKELLKKKVKEKDPMVFKENKLLFHQLTKLSRDFFDFAFSIINPSTALNHLRRPKTAQ